MKVDSVRELVTMIKKDKSLEEEIRKDPAKAIAKITESPQWGCKFHLYLYNHTR